MTQPYYPQQQVPQPPGQPMMPQYPQQPYPGTQMMPTPMQFAYQQPQMVPQQAPQPLVQGTLSDFLNQPSTGGGPVFSWKGKPFGTTYGGIVSRQITDADVQQQTMPGTNMRAFYKDGRPKFLMKVPLTVPATPEFPDGQAQWWVSGSARDELARAMAEAGAESNVPEVGAAIVITLTGERPSGPGMNPSKTYRIQYRRPPGVATAQPAQPTQVQQQPSEWQPGPIATTPAQVMQQMQPVMDVAQLQQQMTQLGQPQHPAVSLPAPPQPQQQMMQQIPVVQPVPQQVPQQVPVQQPGSSDLTPEQQQLLATLTGG